MSEVQEALVTKRDWVIDGMTQPQLQILSRWPLIDICIGTQIFSSQLARQEASHDCRQLRQWLQPHGDQRKGATVIPQHWPSLSKV